MKDEAQTPIMRLVIDITDSGKGKPYGEKPKGKKPKKADEPPEMDEEECEECGKYPCEC